MNTTRDIGSRLELFVDDWLIERMSGVELRLHHPVHREVALKLSRPWEVPSSSYAVVMKEEARYRMWYRASRGDDNNLHGTGYAESDDGIRWTRPSLGIVAFLGSSENNLVVKAATARGMSVFRDGNPAVPESERYKAIGQGPKIDGRATLRGLTSPDGLHWEVVQPDPILVAPDDGTRPIFDSHNIAIWDSTQRRYVIYARGWLAVPGMAGPEHARGVRAIRRSVSDDFRTWSAPEFIDLGDSPPEHLYTNACTQYFRAPHIYLMFPRRFVPERTFHEHWPNNGISEGVFMSSRDGISWDRRFMEAFLRPGPDPFHWTDRNTTAGTGVVPTGPAEISLYYTQHFKHPSVHLRRATLRTDGFVSVNAPYGGGELLTRPLTFSGEELVINYATSVAGHIRVEIQDYEGRPAQGYQMSECAEIFGDEVQRVVAWDRGGDVGALAGQPVRLRFAMKDADLYSIQFRERS